MLFDCKAVFAGLEDNLPFRYELDLTQRDVFFDWQPVGMAVVSGKITNEAGIVSCSLNVSFTLHLSCDRCAEPFDRSFSFDGTAVLVTELSGDNAEDEYILIPDAQFDADEFAESCILLNMPTKILCSEDCKGVCPVCGANLNVQTCSCQTKRVDPRLEALRQLLE